MAPPNQTDPACMASPNVQKTIEVTVINAVWNPSRLRIPLAKITIIE
jgi:hypothetical protein